MKLFLDLKSMEKRFVSVPSSLRKGKISIEDVNGNEMLLATEFEHNIETYMQSFIIRDFELVNTFEKVKTQDYQGKRLPYKKRTLQTVD